MAQCDLSLSYDVCKREERLCKYSYRSWCPTCDRESPRRRAQSECLEPCKKRGKEMKCLMGKKYDPQECENMELEPEAPRELRLDPSRVRANLCELPTSYIANNCQATRIPCLTEVSDAVDRVEWRSTTHAAPMVEKQKHYPTFEELAADGLYRLNVGRFDGLRPHYNPPPRLKPPAAPKSKYKPSVNLDDDFRAPVPQTVGGRYPPSELRNPFALDHDTNTIFDTKIDLGSLKERYMREMEILQRNIREMKQYPHLKPRTPTSLRACEIQMPAGEGRERVGEPHRAVRGGGGLVLTPPTTDKVLSASPSMKLRVKAKTVKSKGKYVTIKMKKQRPKVYSTLEANNSECSDSEDSGKEDGSVPIDDDVSESSSENSIAPTLRASQQFVTDLTNWPVRPSLFPNVAPYLKFHGIDATHPHKLPFGNRYMKWKLSTITPVLVRKTLTNSGFRLVRKSNEWMGTWGKHMKSPMFKTLKEYQKLNHFPGTFHLGRKDRLWRNMQKMMLDFGHQEFGFIPHTYILPQDLKMLKQNWQMAEGGTSQKFIIKPPASARGTGICVINKWWQLPKRMALVVQEYITNPYLINGSKFDLRLYVLVTSFNPLRMYLYPEGLARFASVPYDDDEVNLKNKFIHLTNYSINKLSSSYAANEDANSCQGHKWTLTKLWEYMSANGVDTKSLWLVLKQLVIKTLISCESSIVDLCKDNLNNRYNCYELFGVDVLLDDRLRPWLLEVNISPSLHSQSPLDEFVKGPMVQDLFNLAQFHLPPRLAKVEGKKTPMCHDPRMYTTALTKNERIKHNYYQQRDERESYVNSILDELTGDDVRHLIQAEDELTVLGQFERIFPTSNTHKYFHFLEPRYYNFLFDAWETKYERNRAPAIKLLQTLCKQRVHLQVATVSPFAKNLPNTTPLEPHPVPSKEDQEQGDGHGTSRTKVPPPNGPVKHCSTPIPNRSADGLLLQA